MLPLYSSVWVYLAYIDVLCIWKMKTIPVFLLGEQIQRVTLVLVLSHKSPLG